MAKISKDLAAGTLHPRETLYAAGTLATLGAEVVVAADGAASVSVDVRGTSSLQLEVAGSVDGINWTPIPVRPLASGTITYATVIFAGFTGVLIGKCSAFRLVRARVVQFSSGAATVVLAADTAPVDDSALGSITPSAITATGAAGAAVTLTIPAPGSGLRNYLTSLAVTRFAAATLTAAATPVLVTSTNVPGSMVFPIDADAAPIGTSFTWRDNWALPLASISQSTATTIVCPATTGAIWRVTAGYYVGP